ncbi:uncharacterized protein JCM6883_002871 [Sporobolomyces salmoneus]|uniref:uncharacterized protein n=1 Tax=Sporobolomyces salmoneus TaxID=183962 RepID=UPI0031821C43
MPRARPPRIPFWSLPLLCFLLPLLSSASRPRPFILSKRNPTYSPLSSSSLSLIPTLSDLDSNLNYNNPNSFLSKVLIPRAVGSQNLTRLQKLFEDKFTQLGWHVEKDTFETLTPLGSREFTNLIFTHDPLAIRRFTLSAHLDSKYFPPGSPSAGFVGATDSAVPCAILYDTASSLTSWLNSRKERIVQREGGEEGRTGVQAETLQIVLFDGEEAFGEWSSTDSIYGAKHLVDKWANQPTTLSPSATMVNPKNELERISHLVLLDLLGAQHPVIRNFYSNTGWLFDQFQHSEERLGKAGLLWPSLGGGGGTNYEKVSKELGAKEKSFFVNRKGPQGWMGTIEDDHLPFLKKGVPVVHLISVPFPRVWHTIADDATALDLDTIKAWALIMRLTVAEYLGLDPELNRTNHEEKRDELTIFDSKEEEEGICSKTSTIDGS